MYILSLYNETPQMRVTRNIKISLCTVKMAILCLWVHVRYCFQTYIKYIKFVILLQNAREYEKKYNDYVNHRSQDLVGIEEAPFGYDGVWTIALALQEAERRLQEIGKIH